VDLFCQELLTERTEEIWLHQDVELELLQEAILHPVELMVVQHREELCQRAVPDWLILPHLVCKE
jgi:hypothetical protein